MSNFINATIAGYSLNKVTGPRGVTKASLRKALEAKPESVDFLSQSQFHMTGQYFSVVSMMRLYPDAVAEVRLPNDTIAMVSARFEGATVKVTVR